ncbi:hypothetical protein FHL15_000399 [Xylaria flabelliformis]|uniref:Uncharacterized protein n=1 Tax=Xylaria flabelliformis TaxID=2512241 RepID=A0A553IFS8_9PEZI|nr:hypothetical protein FHL15_000399 [Xylaria flabelliformis]
MFMELLIKDIAPGMNPETTGGVVVMVTLPVSRVAFVLATLLAPRPIMTKHLHHASLASARAEQPGERRAPPRCPRTLGSLTSRAVMDFDDDQSIISGHGPEDVNT